MHGHPLKIGEKVMNEDGETGFVYSLNSMRTEANGIVSRWSATMRYEWNHPLYGQETRISNGTIGVFRDGDLVQL